MEKIVHHSEKVSLDHSVTSWHCPLNVEDRFQCISVYQLGVIYMYNVMVLSLICTRVSWLEVYCSGPGETVVERRGVKLMFVLVFKSIRTRTYRIGIFR